MMTEATQLTEMVTFSTQTADNPDSPADYGNTTTVWADQFTEPAEYTHLRGGETVMAARLAGRHTQVVRVRASPLTRQITPAWRAHDARTSTVFNIRDVTHTPDRRWVDCLVESGVA